MDKQNIDKTEQTNVKKTVGSYEKHPFFVKKNNEAKALLEKVGLPHNYKAGAITKK